MNKVLLGRSWGVRKCTRHPTLLLLLKFCFTISFPVKTEKCGSQNSRNNNNWKWISTFFFPWRIPLPPALVPNSALDLCCLWQSLLKVFLRAPFLKVCCVQLMVGYGRSRAEWFGEVTEPQDFLSCVETLSPSSSRWITPFCWSWHPQRTRTQVLPYKI